MPGHDLGTAHESRQVGRARGLPGVRAHLLEPGLESAVCAEQRFGGHRAGDVGSLEQQLGVGAGEQKHAEHAVGAIDQRKAFLRFELDRLQFRGLERRCRRPRCTSPIEDVAFTDQG